MNPYSPQYDQEILYKDDSNLNGPPPEPRQAFGGQTYYEDDHIYEEPAYNPASLPQTSLVTPRQGQTRALIPTQYATGYVGRPRGRPTSASQRLGTARPARNRPISARTEPMPRYAPSPVRSSPPDRSVAPPSLPVRVICPFLRRMVNWLVQFCQLRTVSKTATVPTFIFRCHYLFLTILIVNSGLFFKDSRYMTSNRPTVTTAPQPSIGTSPRYMVDPERRQDPPSSFDGARVILSRARANVDRFEQDSRLHALDEPDSALEPLYATPQKTTHPHTQPIIRHAQTPVKRGNLQTNPQLEMSAIERQELEAQLLVSRALARARTNVRA